MIPYFSVLRKWSAGETDLRAADALDRRARLGEAGILVRCADLHLDRAIHDAIPIHKTPAVHARRRRRLCRGAPLRFSFSFVDPSAPVEGKAFISLVETKQAVGRPLLGTTNPVGGGLLRRLPSSQTTYYDMWSRAARRTRSGGGVRRGGGRPRLRRCA